MSAFFTQTNRGLSRGRLLVMFFGLGVGIGAWIGIFLGAPIVSTLGGMVVGLVIGAVAPTRPDTAKPKPDDRVPR